MRSLHLNTHRRLNIHHHFLKNLIHTRRPMYTMSLIKIRIRFHIKAIRLILLQSLQRQAINVSSLELLYLKYIKKTVRFVFCWGPKMHLLNSSLPFLVQHQCRTKLFKRSIKLNHDWTILYYWLLKKISWPTFVSFKEPKCRIISKAFLFFINLIEFHVEFLENLLAKTPN